MCVNYFNPQKSTTKQPRALYLLHCSLKVVTEFFDQIFGFGEGGKLCWIGGLQHIQDKQVEGFPGLQALVGRVSLRIKP